MSDFFNGLSILRTVGTGDGGFMHKTIPELEAERDWMASEEEYLKAHEPKRGPDGWTFGKPQSATGGEQKAPRAMDADEKELAERRKVLEAWRKHSAVGEGQVFETSGGERFVPNAQLEAFNKEMAKRGERPRRVQYFRTRGMMDEYGKTLTDAPVTLRWVEGDPKMAYVMDWFRKNPDAQGRMLPEMYRFLGITAEDAQREANDEQARRLEQQELRRGVARNAGKIGAAELSGMSVGFGGQSLTEQNKGKGAAKQTWNWFNARLNPVASLLDEYAQGTELELTSPDGMKTLRERQAAGKPLLTRGERLSLGLWGDVSGLNTPEAVQSYLADRIRNRQEAATEEEARGTTFLADAVRATEDSARMGIEFALVNAATGGGVGMGLVKGGVMKNLGRAVTRPGTLAEVGLHAPAKAKRLMEDKVAFDPQTGELKLTKEGESAWTAVPKAVGASALEYMSEMYTTDLLWKPLARGKAGRWAAEKGGKFVKDKLAPSAVGQFGRKLVESKVGQGTARAMDALAAAPGMDAVRKIAARSGVNLNGVKGMVEESIGEELPATVISSMFNLEG